jgi:hypothetical protein
VSRTTGSCQSDSSGGMSARITESSPAREGAAASGGKCERGDGEGGARRGSAAAPHSEGRRMPGPTFNSLSHRQDSVL